MLPSLSEPFHTLDPVTGRTVQVLRVSEIREDAVRAAAVGSIDRAISEDSFLRRSPLTGEDLGLTYRQGARDAITAIREVLGLTPLEFAPLERHYVENYAKERAVLTAARLDPKVSKAVDRLGLSVPR